MRGYRTIRRPRSRFPPPRPWRRAFCRPAQPQDAIDLVSERENRSRRSKPPSRNIDLEGFNSDYNSASIARVDAFGEGARRSAIGLQKIEGLDIRGRGHTDGIGGDAYKPELSASAAHRERSSEMVSKNTLSPMATSSRLATADQVKDASNPADPSTAASGGHMEADPRRSNQNRRQYRLPPHAADFPSGFSYVRLPLKLFSSALRAQAFPNR